MKRVRNGSERATRRDGSGAEAVRATAGRVLVVDNYDSFTYNLVQRMGELGADVEVVRNDALSADDLIERSPQRIVLSPGPCTPDEAGISLELIRKLCGLDGSPVRRIPILGVCLGHQSIGQAFGGRVVRAPEPVHGKPEEIVHDRSSLFRGVPQPLLAGRYHSLVVADRGLPRDLVISARTRDGIVMALRHRALPVFGVQFHPESILTPAGQTLLRNFLEVRA
ncbi:MAG TPA: aminodeoxychorismate/anthranilate synthase component II [Myxococcales bacterium]|nr:aminodeoxychorismate/anthranilate synthase component II [Myxococcales bacterium]